MQRDIRLYLKNNEIRDIKDIYQYNIYHKADKLEIVLQEDYTITYSLSDITQIDITTRLDGKNWATNTDFILF